jgi:hypothetical protein
MKANDMKAPLSTLYIKLSGLSEFLWLIGSWTALKWDRGIERRSGKHAQHFFFEWGGTYVTRYCGHFWPIVQHQMIDEGDCGAIGGMKIGRGNQSTRRKPAPSAILSTTNPTWPDPCANTGRRGGKPATNRLSQWANTLFTTRYKLHIIKLLVGYKQQ